MVSQPAGGTTQLRSIVYGVGLREAWRLSRETSERQKARRAMAESKPLTQEQAIAAWTELQRLMSVGAYEERSVEHM